MKEKQETINDITEDIKDNKEEQVSIFDYLEEELLEHLEDVTETDTEEITDTELIPEVEEVPEVDEHIIGVDEETEPSKTSYTLQTQEHIETDLVQQDHTDIDFLPGMGERDHAIEEAIFEFKRDSECTIVKKVNNIKVGKYVNVIYGTFDDQKVLVSKLLSTTDRGITVSNEKDINKVPISIPFESIIDIFEVSKANRDKEKFSVFKFKKKIKEFFIGTEEERKQIYEQKIKEKELKEELKKNKRK